MWVMSQRWRRMCPRNQWTTRFTLSSRLRRRVHNSPASMLHWQRPPSVNPPQLIRPSQPLHLHWLATEEAEIIINIVVRMLKFPPRFVVTMNSAESVAEDDSLCVMNIGSEIPSLQAKETPSLPSPTDGGLGTAGVRGASGWS